MKIKSAIQSYHEQHHNCQSGISSQHQGVGYGALYHVRVISYNSRICAKLTKPSFPLLP